MVVPGHAVRDAVGKPRVCGPREPLSAAHLCPRGVRLFCAEPASLLRLVQNRRVGIRARIHRE